MDVHPITEQKDVKLQTNPYLTIAFQKYLPKNETFSEILVAQKIETSLWSFVTSPLKWGEVHVAWTIHGPHVHGIK